MGKNKDMRVHLFSSSRPAVPAQELDVPSPSVTLASLLWGQGHLPPRPLCAGIGHCGRCRVRFLSAAPALTARERELLRPEEQQAGVRLACCHQAAQDMEIVVEGEEFSCAERERGVTEASGRRVRLAVDLGTTSLVWAAVDEKGALVEQGHQLNPQMGAGTDVMARLAAAAPERGAGAAARMKDAVVQALQELVRHMQGRHMEVREICLAANPAMTLLALGLDSSGLRAAPYRLSYRGGASFTLPELPPLWIPPLPAPFVGGDLSAGLCALLHGGEKHAFPLLLADMGTNGEFALLRRPDEQPLLASVPLGPALEGIGLRCGGMAEAGAVTSFHAAPSGLTPTVLGSASPRCICGVGYLSLLNLLIELGLLDREGHFVRHADKAHPLAFLRKRLAATLESRRGEPVLPLTNGLFLAASDVESLLKVKAAFSLAVTRLLLEAELRPAEVGEVVLAGALGQHAPLDALTGLGFLPSVLRSRTRAVGNSSLQGAVLLCHHPEMRGEVVRLCEGAQQLTLAEDPYFHQYYVRHMYFGSVESAAASSVN